MSSLSDPDTHIPLAARTGDWTGWLYRHLFAVLCVMIGLLYLTGLPIHLMEPDASVYAILSKNMVQTGNYWDLFLYGKDWLDKPHFPFWITALSFQVWGINSEAYKLPALLFVALAAVYTYRFAKELYSTTVAQLSVLILLTALHIILSNSDVRAEPYLTGLTVAATYHFYRLQRQFSWQHLLWGSLFAACALMTKGLFTIVPIGGAIFTELLLKRQWSQLFHWKWLVVAVVTLVFTTPELYSLYHQFDSHPEKVVFGETNVSGIRFFFWDSQFGRFFNTGPIKGQGDKFFFLHTLLWAFLPWALLMYYAFVKLVRDNFRRVQLTQEFYTVGGSVLTILMFSLSKFQLPHYSNIVFPFLAILTAQGVVAIGTTNKGLVFYKSVQYFTIVVLLAAIGALQYFFRPPDVFFVFVLLVIILLGIGFAIMRSQLAGWIKVFYQTCVVMLIFGFYLNLIFYPALLTYQSSSQAAFYANEQFPNQPTAVYGDIRTLSYDFYARQPVQWYFTLDELKQAIAQRPLIVYTTADKLHELTNAGIRFEPIGSFDEFHVTTLSAEFINHRTRQEALHTNVLVKVQQTPLSK